MLFSLIFRFRRKYGPLVCFSASKGSVVERECVRKQKAGSAGTALWKGAELISLARR